MSSKVGIFARGRIRDYQIHQFIPKLSLDFVASDLSWRETGARTGFRRGGIVSL